MKIISFTKVANDCEVIESFIRYNSQFVDKMLFVSSCCVDNTLTIIRNMIREGFNIELIEEADISFEERYLDNKYLRMIAQEAEYDLILPVDADEFITGDGNPREIMEKLPLDRVYFVNWYNYVMTEADDMQEAFIPRRLIHVNSGAKTNDVCKVIIPSRLMLEKKIVTSAGRHAITGEAVKTEFLSNLCLAHYPSVSKDQYLLRIYEGMIKSIIRTDQGNTEGAHRRQQYAMLKAGKDVFKVAGQYGYGCANDKEQALEKKPLDLKYHKPEDLKISYADLARTDIISGLVNIGQLMAIKAYIQGLRDVIFPEKKNILIFGTGKEAGMILNGISENMINVLAYIDSDEIKQFGMYNRRLVIPPDHCRFFKYDKIIISSNKYYDEMLSILLELGINREKIDNAGYLLELMKEIKDKNDGRLY